jgi:actin-related protein 6
VCRQPAAGITAPDPGPAVTINNERFMVPEALFHPSDIGVPQAGACEAISQCLQACHPALQPLLAQNIVLAGGTSCCPGFKARVEQDLPPLMDCYWQVHVNQAEDPAGMAWRGASIFAASGAAARVAISKQEYDEHGSARKLSTFASVD